MTSQVSVAADRGAINWDDLNWERSYDGMRAYSQSKIAFGLFGLELDRRSQAARLGHHQQPLPPRRRPDQPAGRPPRDRPGRGHPGVRVIRALSARGILARHRRDRAAARPAWPRPSPDAAAARFYGPSGPGHLGGPPAEQKLYSPLRSADDAERIWQVSEELTEVSFPDR